MDRKKLEESLQAFQKVTDKELHEFISEISYATYQEAFELISKAKKNNNRVHITGIGKPSYVAGYIASLFSSTGTPAYVLHGTEAIHGSSGQVKAGDVVIAISNSGETEELKKTIQTLKANQALVIGVSGGRDSWLAKHSDSFLFAGVEEEGGPLNKAPRTSYLAETIALQSLSILLQVEENIGLKEYKNWHPGGALGASIK